MFDAYETAEAIRKNISEFILDWKNVSDEEIRKDILTKWTNRDPQQGGLVSQLLIENNFPYLHSKERLCDILPERIAPLIKQLNFLDNVISKGALPKLPNGDPYFNGHEELKNNFIKLIKDNKFNSSNYVYTHQLKTIKKSLEENKNIILSSGTGSGKTEAFLIPTLARLFSESDEERRQPGIRVIILYPMNALINNQIKRLQVWLGVQDPKRVPIRFGLYNSKLREDVNRKSTYNNNTSIYAQWPNLQTISRNELRQNPPHILVTNYSMLEYALIRPADIPLFIPERRKLHTIILDEAHTYIGAMAAEITMLLRRILSAFNKNSSDIHFFATSATIGDPEKDDGKILKEFCKDIFSTNIDSVEAILGKRSTPNYLYKNKTQDITIDTFLSLIFAFNNSDTKIIKKLSDEFKINNLDVQVLFNELISRTPHFKKLLNAITKKPLFLKDIADIFEIPEDDQNRETTANTILKQLSILKNNNDESLFPVRAHLVCNAPSGIYKCKLCNTLNTNRDICRSCNSSEIYEIVVCKKCGKVFYVSGINGIHPPKWEKAEKIVLYDADTKLPIDITECSHCKNKSEEEIINDFVHADNDYPDDNLKIFRKYFFQTFSVSSNLIQQIVLDSMYEYLEPVQNKSDDFLPGRGRKLLSFTDNRQKAAKLASRMEWTHDNLLGRKIIINALKRLDNKKKFNKILENKLKENGWDKFVKKHTDFIEYLHQHISTNSFHHNNKKEKVTNFLIQNKQIFNPDYFPLKDFSSIVFDTLNEAEYSLFTFYDISKEIEQSDDIKELTSFTDKTNDIKLVSQCLLAREFMILPRGNQLETVGLCAVRFPHEDKLKSEFAKNYFLQKYKNIPLFIEIAYTILHRLRKRGIVTAPFIDRPTHNEFIDYALRKKYINRSASLHNTSRNPREERLLPKQETNNNSFIDIIRKALPKVVISEARTIISELWTNMVSVYRGNLLKEMEVHDDERSYSINTEALLVEFSPKVYMCETCNKILPYALNGKCTDISCNGTVNEVNTDYLIKNKYGYKRVLNYPLLGMKTVEHTAQIDLNELTENEKHFTKGKINFLSSSTTMELGIDIGGLTSIFLSNCPPGPANYLQRAGRAGRRSDNTSLVVTNARRIPIDQYFFFKPDLFFTKKQHNPYVSLSSKKIISRHINAYILSAYFKSLAEMNTIAVNNPLKVFGSVEGFFLHNEYNDPFDKFFSWLVEHGVKNNTSAIKKLISNTGLEGIEIESYIEDFALHMYALSSTINEYYGKLSKSINKAEQENKQSFKRLLEHQQKYFFKQDLIRFLIEKQILPKYGFPVDIIQLNTKNKDTINKTTTRLERDISIAISEYAPGNTVIANKREIVSQGISTDFYFGGESFAENLSPIKDNFHYVICNKCNHFYLIQNFGNNADCPVCHQKDYIHATQNYNFNPPDSTPTRNIQGNYSTSAYIPKGFAVDYNDTQSYDNSFRDSDKVYSQVFPYLPYDLDEMSHALNGNMLIKSYDEATFYTINNGLKFGYAICLYCGRAELEHGYNYPLSDSMKNHFHLRKDKEKCRGISNDSIKRYKSLAAKYTTDAIRIRLRYKLNPSKYFENNKLKTFFRTLARTMLITSCKKLGIDERELSYTLVPFSSDNLFSSQYDIVIYDDVPGGAGYAQVIEEMLYSKIYYDELIDNLHCFENCKGACPACILDFDNIEQDEIKYNRHLVLDYFKQPIVKHMINSSTTSNGTIDNSRIIMHPKQEFLSQLQKRGLQIIELYFHEIRDGDFDITNKVFRKLLSLAQKGIPTHLLFTSDEKSILKNELLRYKLLLLNKEGADHIGAFLCKDNKNRLARIVYNDKTLTYSVFTQAVSDSESVASIFTKEPILEHCAVHAEEPYSPAGINFDINFSSKKTVLEISESQNALQLPWDLICTKFDLEKETKIKSIYYSDRYFFSKRQIISLLKTVHGMNYDELLSLTIASTPVMPSRSFDSFKNDNERVEFVKTTAQEINIKNVNMFSAKGKGDFPGSQHQREMLIVKNNDELIRLVFDKGMDLYKPKIPRGWNNKLREINTFSYQNNIIFLLEETKERNEYLDKRILDAKNKGLLI